MNECIKKISMLVLGAALVGVAQAAEEPSAEVDGAVVIAKGVPGGMMVSVVEIQARVVDIDFETRMVELLLPGGVTEEIVVGPEAVNFKQIKKGDIVKAMVTEELVVRMGSADAELKDGEVVAAVAAEEGEQPGAIAVDVTRDTATVVALDGLVRTATLMFEDGTTRVVPVRDDIDLTQHRLGEKVVFEYTQMVAISVEKQ